jgi:hypothetical protein
MRCGRTFISLSMGFSEQARAFQRDYVNRWQTFAEK